MRLFLAVAVFACTLLVSCSEQVVVEESTDVEVVDSLAVDTLAVDSI